MAHQHTEEFRAEAVRLALTSGLSRKQVAADLGIGFSTLSRWVQLHRQSDATEAPDPDLHQEVLRLRKENRVLKEEREILKKATVFFASQK
jgi:transposase